MAVLKKVLPEKRQDILAGTEITYGAWEVDAILELTEKVGDEEAAKHQAHGEQGGVGVGSFTRFVDVGNIAMLICTVMEL